MTIHEDDNKEDHENIVQARKRSYLVGSVGPTSLLGTQELERQLPNRTIRIFVGTWNMNGQVLYNKCLGLFFVALLGCFKIRG